MWSKRQPRLRCLTVGFAMFCGLTFGAKVEDAPGHAPGSRVGLMELSAGELVPANSSGLGDKTPVVYVHGWNQSMPDIKSNAAGFQEQIHKHIARFDDDFKLYVFVYDWSIDIGQNGQWLARTLERFPSNRHILIVGHSMGGLVARSCTEEHLKRADQPYLITLGTPHHGTPLACPWWLGDSGASAAQSKPGLALLKNLLPDNLPDCSGTFCLGYDDYGAVMHPLGTNGEPRDWSEKTETRTIRALNDRLIKRRDTKHIISRYAVMGGYIPDVYGLSGDLPQAVISAIPTKPNRNKLIASICGSFYSANKGSVIEFRAADGPVPLVSSLFLWKVGPPIYSEDTTRSASPDLPDKVHVSVRQSGVTSRQWVPHTYVIPNADHSSLPINSSVHKKIALLINEWNLRPDRTNSGPGIILCLDGSGSMTESLAGGVAKWDAVRKSVRDIIQLVETEGTAFGNKPRLGVVSFSDDVGARLAPTEDMEAVLEIVDSIHPDGGTNIGVGLLASEDLLPGATGNFIFLLSDGERTAGDDPRHCLQPAIDSGTKVMTIGFGDGAQVAYDEGTLRDIASKTGGKFFSAGDLLGLSSALFASRHQASGKSLLTAQGTAAKPGVIDLGQFDPSITTGGETTAVGDAFAQVKANAMALLCTANWANGKAMFHLFDPTGAEVDERYKGATISIGPPTILIVKDPLPGAWRASLDATEVGSGGLQYDVQVSGRAKAPGSSISTPAVGFVAPVITTLGVVVFVLAARYLWIVRSRNRVGLVAVPLIPSLLDSRGVAWPLTSPVVVGKRSNGSIGIGSVTLPFVVVFVDSRSGPVARNLTRSSSVLLNGKAFGMGEIHTGDRLLVEGAPFVIR